MNNSIKDIIINEKLKFDSLCHNDLNFGNMMKINEKINFIDFEFVSYSDPCLDIARFFYCMYYHFYHNSQTQDIFEAKWNINLLMKFLCAYYEVDIVNISIVQKIKRISVITNYFNFLYNLSMIKEKESELVTNKRFMRIQKHCLHILEYDVINYCEYQSIIQLINLLKNK